ncbi:hypothetical protein D3C71_1070540 [compost metagenome]
MHVDGFGQVGIYGQFVAVVGGNVHQQGAADFRRDAQLDNVLALPLGILNEADQLRVHRLCYSGLQNADGKSESAAPAFRRDLPPLLDLKQIPQRLHDAAQRANGPLVLVDEEGTAHDIALGLDRPTLVPAVNGTLPGDPGKQVSRRGFRAAQQADGNGDVFNVRARDRSATLQRRGIVRQERAPVSHRPSRRKFSGRWRCRFPPGWDPARCLPPAPAAPGVLPLRHEWRP